MEPTTPLRAVTELAAEHAELLEHVHGLADDGELAQLGVVKVQDAAGAVARAHLALRGRGEPGEAVAPIRERRAALARAVGDAVVALAVLADAEGLSFDAVVAGRMAELRNDRPAMLARRKGGSVEPGVPDELGALVDDLVPVTAGERRAMAAGSAEAQEASAQPAAAAPTKGAKGRAQDGPAAVPTLDDIQLEMFAEL
jgi:hypothetical protein